MKRQALTDDQKIAAYLKRHKPTHCPPSGGVWREKADKARRNGNHRKRALGAAKTWQTRRRHRNG